MEAPRVEDELKKHQNMYGELKSIKRKQEERARRYGSEALYQTAFYLIFEALVLLCACIVPCRSWWIPLCLSLLTSFLFALTFTGTIVNYVGSRLEADLNVLQLEGIRRRISVAESGSGGDEPMMIKPDKFRMYKLYAWIYAMVLALLAFAVIQMYACRYIPCKASNELAFDTD